jgi:hypothetical protein
MWRNEQEIWNGRTNPESCDWGNSNSNDSDTGEGSYTLNSAVITATHLQTAG